MNYKELSQFTYAELKYFKHCELMKSKHELLKSLTIENRPIPPKLLDKLSQLCADTLNALDNIKSNNELVFDEETSNALKEVKQHTNTQSIDWRDIILIITFILDILSNFQSFSQSHYDTNPSTVNINISIPSSTKTALDLKVNEILNLSLEELNSSTH